MDLRRHPEAVADILIGAADVLEAHPEWWPIIALNLRNVARDLERRKIPR